MDDLNLLYSLIIIQLQGVVNLKQRDVPSSSFQAL
jgi:hypothetical protein